MPRVAAVDRPVRFHLSIPESIYSRMQLILFSEIEHKVPYGAISNFIITLIRKWMDEERLELSAYGIDGQVQGDARVVKKLELMLQEYQLKERTNGSPIKP